MIMLISRFVLSIPLFAFKSPIITAGDTSVVFYGGNVLVAPTNLHRPIFHRLRPFFLAHNIE